MHGAHPAGLSGERVTRRGTGRSPSAHAGLAPREGRSGTSVRKPSRPSQAGNARLRTALDLPTPTAARFDPVLEPFSARLVDAGEPKMSAVGACLRKLVVIWYGVLQGRTPFDPAYPRPARAAGGSAGIPSPADPN